jgi:hypothetical protein
MATFTRSTPTDLALHGLQVLYCSSKREGCSSSVRVRGNAGKGVRAEDAAESQGFSEKFSTNVTNVTSTQ